VNNLNMSRLGVMIDLTIPCLLTDISLVYQVPMNIFESRLVMLWSRYWNIALNDVVMFTSLGQGKVLCFV